MTKEKRATEKPVKVDVTMEELMKQAVETDPIGLKDVSKNAIPEGETQIVLFKKKEIRKVLHNNEWWYSVSDIVEVLTESTNVKDYIKKIRSRDKELSKGWGQIVTPLSIETSGGKQKLNCANAEGIFRIIQSIHSKRAEPFKKWLAKTAYERVLEHQNPEIAIKRAIMTYQLQGRSDEWIKNRLQTRAGRNELTAEWKKRDIEEKGYGVLTNTIHKGAFGKTVGEHKTVKNLKNNHNLRDHMSGLELVLTMLGEEATKEIAIKTDAIGLSENNRAAKAGGDVAGAARKGIEKETGETVLSSENFLPKKKKQEKLIDGE